MKPSLLPFLSFTLALVCKDNAIIPISQAIAGAAGGRGVKAEVSFAFQMPGFVIKNSCLSLNGATLVKWVCAPAGFVFVCGTYILLGPVKV